MDFDAKTIQVATVKRVRLLVYLVTTKARIRAVMTTKVPRLSKVVFFLISDVFIYLLAFVSRIPRVQVSLKLIDISFLTFYGAFNRPPACLFD